MFVLDRSCSMADKAVKTDPGSKWDSALAAIESLLATYGNDVDFGLIMFPDQTGEACLQESGAAVPVGSGTAQAIMAKLASTKPNGPCQTPIDTGVAAIAGDPVFAGAARADRAYALLVTDGMQSPGCGGTARDATTEHTLASLQTLGYPTFVIGFGGEVYAKSLNGFAASGGVPRAGATKYYQAADAQALDQTLGSIVAGVVSSGGEFTQCVVPCSADGRCFGENQTCVMGFCAGPALSNGQQSPSPPPTPPSPSFRIQGAAELPAGCAALPGTPRGGTWLALLAGAAFIRRPPRRRRARAARPARARCSPTASPSL
jgi:hypothetical protein